MGNVDDYNKLVDFIGNIIKATSEPEDQAGVDDALDIAHTVGRTDRLTWRLPHVRMGFVPVINRLKEKVKVSFVCLIKW